MVETCKLRRDTGLDKQTAAGLTEVKSQTTRRHASSQAFLNALMIFIGGEFTPTTITAETRRTTVRAHFEVNQFLQVDMKRISHIAKGKFKQISTHNTAN